LSIFLFVFAVLITLGVYSLCRLQFLLWNWSFFQQQPITEIVQAFWHALRFDLSAIAILSMIPFLVFWLVSFLLKTPLNLRQKRALLGLFTLFQMPTLIFNLGDAEFIHFLGRRYTFDALFLFREIPGKFWSLLFSYWKLNLIDFAILGFFVYLAVFWLPRKTPEISLRRKQILAVGIAVFAILGIAARGGLQSKPINFAHAQIFAQPMMNSLVLNSSFTLIQTVKRASLPRDRFFSSDEEMLKWLRFGLGEKSLLEGHRPVQKPNVVVIIMESMGLEYMGKHHGDQGYTPFLDELSEKSLFFPNAFANARRSIEGIGAIMGGIPSLMNEPFISSQYLTNYFLGVGTRLQTKGYHTSFFHGAQNETMYFNQFMKSAGVKHYLGRNEYPNAADDDGSWGIFDEPFLNWMQTQISAFPQPFFSTVFTLSSHHPFTIPEAYRGRFPKGTSEIHESIGYTDEALRQFFAKVSQQPWFQNTIFILTADHTYKPHRPEYQNDLGLYRVPLIVYAPGIQLPKVDTHQVVQQIDILPTILDLLDIPETERNFLGSSVFVPGDRFAVNYFDGRYLFVTKNYFLTHNRDADFQLYSMKDADQKNPLSDLPEKKEEMSNRLKAVIQYFSQGMWDNKLYYPSGK